MLIKSYMSNYIIGILSAELLSWKYVLWSMDQNFPASGCFVFRAIAFQSKFHLRLDWSTMYVLRCGQIDILSEQDVLSKRICVISSFHRRSACLNHCAIILILFLILWICSKINVYYVGKRAGKNLKAHQVGKTRAFFRLDTNS